MVPAPVVLHFHSKAGVEGVVGVAGDADIVVPVDAQALGEGLRGVGDALVGEGIRCLAEVGIEDALQASLPLGGNGLGLAGGDGLHVGRHHAEELVEVGQRVANHGAGLGHCILGDDAVVLDDDEHVAGRTALREVAVAMHTNGHISAFHVVFVADKHLGQIIGLASLLQNFGLKEAQCRIRPAGAAAVLVLDTGDW